MKRPVLAYTSIAAIAAAALGFTVYREDLALQMQKADVEQAKPVVVETKPVDVSKPKDIAVSVVVPNVEPAPVLAGPAKDIEPSFDTVRVEKTGEAVIAGHAEPDAEVTVKLNGDVVGKTTSNADGSFVVVPEKPLAKGTGALTLSVAKNGEVTESEGSVVVSVLENAPAMVAKVDAKEPTLVLQDGATDYVAKDVQLTAVDYDATGAIIFSGKAAPGSIVRFYVDNKSVGEGAADASGFWSFKGTSNVPVGTHLLRADAVDTAGKVQSRIELPFMRETIEAVAAAQVAVAEPSKVVEAKPVVVEEAKQPDVIAAPAPAETVVEKTVEPVAQPAQGAVAAAPEPAPVVVRGPTTLVIQPGNSLWKLSRDVYGKGRMYTVIYKANRDQLRSPHKIFPGQILTAPAPKG
jgi:nucleoid-associated protein YgaU